MGHKNICISIHNEILLTITVESPATLDKREENQNAGWYDKRKRHC